MRIKIIITWILSCIFCSIFFIGALITSPDTELTTEKRKVTPLPAVSLLWTSGIKLFFKNMDSYISDHLLYKDTIFLTTSKILSRLFVRTDMDTAVTGQNGWLFLGNNYNKVLDKHTKEIPLNEIYAQSRFVEFSQLADAARSKRAAFVVEICPDKHAVYYEFLPKFLNYRPQKRFSEKLICYLREKNIPIFDGLSTLIKHKNQGNLYYKTDTHWNSHGAEIAFYGLWQWLTNSVIQKKIDFEKEYALKIAPTYFGDLISIGGYYGIDIKNDVNYTLVQAKNTQVQFKIQGKTIIDSPMRSLPTHQEGFSARIYNKNAVNKFRIVIFCDSFMYIQAPYFNMNFSDILYVNRRCSVKEKIDFISSFNPELVIFETVERDL